MKALTTALIIEKNKIASPNPWLITLDVTWPNDDISRFVRNTENITFQSNVYTAIPFEVDVQSENSKGQMSQLSLRISNIGKAVTSYLEQTGGAIGSRVVVRLINANLLAENYADLELTYDVMNTSLNNQWAVFTLGCPNPLRAPFPRLRFLPNHCGWASRFKNLECKYVGAPTACNGTITSCFSYQNAINFGGFPGLSGGIRIV